MLPPAGPPLARSGLVTIPPREPASGGPGADAAAHLPAQTRHERVALLFTECHRAAAGSRLGPCVDLGLLIGQAGEGTMDPRSGSIEPVAAKDPAHQVCPARIAAFAAAACAEREAAPKMADPAVAATEACADVPRPGAVADVGGHRRLVELEATATVAERSLVLGISKRDSREHLVGNFHIYADDNAVELIVAATRVAAMVVVPVVVHRVGVELILWTGRVESRPHAIVDGTEVGLLDLQWRFAKQTDFLRRLDNRSRVVGNDLMTRRRRVHSVGEGKRLPGVGRDQRCRGAVERARRGARRRRDVGQSERRWI